MVQCRGTVCQEGFTQAFPLVSAAFLACHVERTVNLVAAENDFAVWWWLGQVRQRRSEHVPRYVPVSSAGTAGVAPAEHVRCGCGGGGWRVGHCGGSFLA